MTSMRKVLGTFLIASLAGFAAIAGYIAFVDQDQTVVVERIVEQPPVRLTSSIPAAAGAMDFTVAAERTVNAVVHVKTEAEVETAYNPWLDMFGSEGGTQIQRGSGSGVIISSNGYIVTNNHVVAGAENIRVSLNNNKSYEAEVIGTDPATDLALLKVEGNDFPVVSFGDSDDLLIGEWVLAVGNPFELTSTVTAGIVSAKARNINLLQPDYNREIFPIESFIQTDAAVNPGNSGGALVNTAGELVGINTAIASRTGSYSGYSFAVPVSIVEKVTKDLMEFGEVQRAFIGVRINEVSEELAEELGLGEIAGVYVNELVENGAAALSGIEPGDVITKVDNREVKNVPELQEQVSRFRPGDEVLVSLIRDGKTRDISVTLRNKEGDTNVVLTEKRDVSRLLGAELADVLDSEKTKLGIHGGAKVLDIGAGKLRTSGIKENFIITKVDGQKIYDSEDFENILKDKTGGVLVEGVYPNGTKAYYGFGI